MLLENIPNPYKETMSEYTDNLLQADKLQMNTFLADGKWIEYQHPYKWLYENIQYYKILCNKNNRALH